MSDSRVTAPLPDRPDDAGEPPGRTFGALVRLFLTQLLAVAAVTAVLTAVYALVVDDSSRDGVTTAAQSRSPGSDRAESPGGPAASSPGTGPVVSGGPASSSPSGSSRSGSPSGSPPARSEPPSSTPPTATGRPEVVVLNQSAGRGAAARAAAALRDRGWSIFRTADFRGTVRTTTVYYSTGQEAAARRAAKDLPGATRVLPRFSNLSRTRLTVIVTR